MRRKFATTAAVAAATVASVVVALAGPPGAADAASAVPAPRPAPQVAAATAAGTAVVSSHYVKIAGLVGLGLHLSSEHLNRDGSVTSQWTAKDGEGFTYAGSPGATIRVASTNGHLVAAAITLASVQKTPAAIAKAIAAYRSQSLYTDAINAGVKPAVADKTLAKDRPSTGIRPADVLTGSYFQGGCIFPKNPPYSDGNMWACAQRNLLQENGSDWWVADDLEANENTFNLPYNSQPSTAMVAEMWYGAGNVVTHQASLTGATNCSEQETDISVGTGAPVNINVTDDITHDLCGGEASIILHSGQYGVEWSGNTNGSQTETIEGVDTVHSPPSASIGNSDFELNWGTASSLPYYINCAPPFSSCSSTVK